MGFWSQLQNSLYIFTFNNTTNEYSTINTARSALSIFLPSIAGMTVGKHPLIRRVMEGGFRKSHDWQAIL